MKKFDNSFLSESIKRIAGTDEAGRGPLAGPVVAAAVIFENDVEIAGINDSKKLTEAKRNELYLQIIEKCLGYAVTIIDNNEIDRINILQASLKAMKDSVNKLNIRPDLILIDGNKKFQIEIPVKTIVKGDSLSHSIAAASIIAKVTRDKIMEEAAQKYPQYKWDENKGYATVKHREAISKFGISPLHRISFLGNILKLQPDLFDV